MTPENAGTAELLDLAVHVARAAGDFLRDAFGRRLERREKTSARDLVSDADLRAERIVVDALRSARADDAVVGEEYGAVAGRSGLTWAVDPLDGTSNFLAGIPHWATAIACEDDAGPVVAVVYDPTRDELFAAARGCGTTVDGGPAAGSACGDLRTAIGALSPAWEEAWHAHRIRLADRLLAAVAHGRQMGSLALDLAWTAAGRFDFLYYECALNPWDVAIRLLADEAGLVTELLPPRPDRPGALLAAPPSLRDALLELL
ncbi:MAG TPA: inositol monophosphatase family protein [Gaiellaceae bacterium]|nr:inositol monophosphatase family protein [Gaiellaceae bacterium]